MSDPAKEHWAAVSEAIKTSQSSDKSPDVADDPRVAEARKKLIKIINWSLNDDKHRKVEQIHDTVIYLQRIVNNVLASPNDEKFRSIRITNATFGKHVRDAPGGEEFMIAAGWHAVVKNHERSFIFEYHPGDVGWRILEIASAELAKLEALLAHKMGYVVVDKHKDEEARRKAVLLSLEDDRAQRRLRFKYSGGGGGSGGDGDVQPGSV